MEYPKILMIRQDVDAPKVPDIPRAIQDIFYKLHLGSAIKPGARVAITAGSRGVRDMVSVIREIVRNLKLIGAVPFVAPAMGSHGGATDEGQTEVLESLGINRETIDAPILSSMETDDIGQNKYGASVLIGSDFTRADHVIVLNRIKAHTDFKGNIESGLYKIMMIGMGKHAGAALAHRLILKHGFEEVVTNLGKIILSKVPVVAGVGIVENHYDETAIIDGFLPNDILSGEMRLLRESKRMMARIPFDDVDVLIVDEMGKAISGTGMDTNVINRIFHQATPEPSPQQFKRIYVRDLTEDTHGNAIGIGLADFTSTRLVSKIDFHKMRVNCVTGTTPEKGRVPLAYDRDDDAIADAIYNAGVINTKYARLAWIKNTLELEHLYISHAIWDSVADKGKFQLILPESPLPFDAEGNLPFGMFDKKTAQVR
jgi:hypothetical protein